MSELVLYETDGAVGTVTINRPEARNALTLEMYDRIAEICAAPSSDGGVKVLIITGAGDRAFAAGTDISLFRGFQEPEDALGYEERLERVFSAIEASPVPTIAAIAGACTGGGASIAVACDVRIAARNAVFGFPIARTLGNCLSVANLARLVSMIGAGRTMDMLVTARLIDAATAEAIGLISETVPDHVGLMERARELAQTLAEHAPLTIRATKAGLQRLRQGRRDDRDLLTMCYMSEDFREGLEAFLAKRKADWQGR